jgi:hypothetical protein
MDRCKARTCRWLLLTIVCLAVGCRQAGFSLHETATLDSLRQVDDWPLYVMHYRGAYAESGDGDEAALDKALVEAAPAYACALFAALGDPASQLFGRSFDWRNSPAVLVFADPPATDTSPGYASVSMIDTTYLGIAGAGAVGLDEAPLAERHPLLWAPYVPIDGMNERGLAIGMAAVSPGNVPVDPNKETIGSLGVMREVLDGAANVDEALEIVDRYNIRFEGPPLHYLIADRSGNAALVEYYQGERIVHRNVDPWHLATNYIVSSVESTEGECRRYDTLDRLLTDSQGRFSPQRAMEGLAAVAQRNTQWSITYNLSTGQVQVAMGGNFDELHTFKLKTRR